MTTPNAISPFNPPARTLLGPGPSDVSPRVLAALARPTIGHLDPAFTAMMEELKILLRYAFQTENALTFPVSGPGSVGMETCFVNLIEPGDKVIVCRNGVFGGRMKENVERCGATAIMVEDPWGRAVDVAKVEQAFKDNAGVKALAFVHAETSTGAQSDAAALCKLAHAHGAVTIVDAVTSLGGSPLKVDEWEIDAIYSGSQKCLSCVPGLSPVSFNERALSVVKNRKTRVQSWFMDLNLVLGYWNQQSRTYHHTAPINALYALHEALILLREEGLEAAWQRHQANHLSLRAGIEALGLNFVVPENERLPQLNAISIPTGVKDADVRGQLLRDYGLEIGAGLGDMAGKIWRIGLMGYGSNARNILFCLAALESVLQALNADIRIGVAQKAAQAA